MNRFISLFCLFALVLITTTGFAQSHSTANEVAPMPVVTSPLISFPVMATPTLTLAATAQAMPPVPSGSKGVIVRCTTSATVNYGGTNVVSGSGWPQIATDTEKTFYFSAVRPPTIYFYANATGTTPTLRFTPFK